MNIHVRSALLIVALLVSASFAQDSGPGAPGAPALSEKDTAELQDAEELTSEVYRLFQARRYDEALPLAERVMAVRERILGPDHPDVAHAMMNVAAQHIGLGALAKAEEFSLKALTTLERALGPDDVSLTTLLNNLAATRRMRGDSAGALLYAERAVRIVETAYGKDSPEYAERVDVVGALLTDLGRTEDAAACAEQSLAIREKHASGENDLAVATSRVCLAGVRVRQHRESEALVLLKRALPVIEGALGRSHPDVAMALDWLGYAQCATGNAAGAADSHERALRIYLGLGEGWLDETIISRGGWAQALTQLGRYDDAIRQHRLAIEQLRKSRTPDSADLARQLHHYSTTLALRGQLTEAGLALAEAAELLRRAFGEDNEELAANYNNRALLLRTSGAYNEALPLFEHALAILTKRLGPGHYEVARCTNNLGAVLSSLGRKEEAVAATEQSVKIALALYGPDHPTTFDFRVNLATLYTNHGEIEKGRRLLEEMVAAAEARIGPDAPRLAGPLENLASLRLEAEDHRGAATLLDRSLKLRAMTTGTESEEYAETLMARARAHAGLGETPAAETTATEGLRIIEGVIRQRFAGLSTNQRLGLVAMARRHLHTWLAVAGGGSSQGYDKVIRFKGIAARATGAERALARESGAVAARRVDEVRALEHKLAELTNSIPFGKDARAAWQEQYARTAADREAKTLALARDFAPLRAGLERLDIDIAAVQAALRPGEVLIDYVEWRVGYLAFVVPKSGEVKRIPLPGIAEIESRARDFVERTADTKTAADDPAWIASGTKLADRIFEPLRQAIGADVKALVICPDSVLASVPFAALPAAGKKGTVLLDVYDITTVSMAQDLVRNGEPTTSGTGCLLVGGVTYDRAGDAPEKRAPPAAPVELTASRSGDVGKFVPLPGTAREVETLAARLGDGATRLTGTSATESALRASVRGRRLVHIATHGFVRSDTLAGLRKRVATTAWLGPDAERQMASGYDPMLLSGLAMAGASVRAGGGTDDGVITAAEASYLDLRGVELVTLSACQTALGHPASGEGVIGLVQAFQMAGARCVVASLWRVDDEATRLFMEAFYDGLLDTTNPLPAAAALRRAAQKVRATKDASGRSLAGPAFWAPFVAYGR